MRRYIFMLTAFFVLLIGVFTASGTAEIENSISISDEIRSFMLVNNTEEMTKLIQYDEEWKLAASEQMVRQDEESKHTTFTDKERQVQIETWFRSCVMIPEKSFSFYPLITTRYAGNYAQNSCFDSIIDTNKKLWYAATRSPYPYFYTAETFELATINIYKKSGSSMLIADDETIDYLNRPEEIEKMVSQEIDDVILDCKIVVIPYGATVLYLKGAANEYGIKIYHDKGLKNEYALLESFKIYPMHEIIQSCANYEKLDLPGLLDTKPTYEAEMTSLMEEGLLQGTDKGAEPLKPLSRMEATTILVRALGLENEPVSAESQFTDVEPGSWGVKYANIALAQGITNGVGDGKFAPEERISAEQFGTLVLRSSGQTDFDWTQAVNILIERGIITQEQADTMDLFTRADMAKIIYEARENGLL